MKMAWRNTKNEYESERTKHNRLLKENPSRAKELQNKLSAEMLVRIVQCMCWSGETERETAKSVAQYFDGITKEEIHTISKQLEYVAQSAIFRELSKICK
jgi:hypothetical protein